MEAITTEEIKIVRNKEKIERFATYDLKKVKNKNGDKELTITKKTSPKTGKYWRLIYKEATGEILHLIETEGETITPWDMFCGTLEECNAEIANMQVKAKKVTK